MLNFQIHPSEVLTWKVKEDEITGFLRKQTVPPGHTPHKWTAGQLTITATL